MTLQCTISLDHIPCMAFGDDKRRWLYHKMHIVEEFYLRSYCSSLLGTEGAHIGE